jgi:hypothetical protein
MSKTKPKRGPTKRGSSAWVIIHCEYFPTSVPPCAHPWMDEMVFHVASSLHAAERYMRLQHVAPYSWWKVECRQLDEVDRPVTSFYNYRGIARKSPPHALARRAYDKWQIESAMNDNAK